MKRVFLTAGPRGAGKSTLCEKAALTSSDIQLISRDNILVELFGQSSFSPYDGPYPFIAAYEKALGLLTQAFAAGNIIPLFDYWNGTSVERKKLIASLKECGAEEVSCLYFTTPLETTLEWFKSKEDRGVMYIESSVTDCYNRYHKEAESIKTDGFNSVHTIDGTKMSTEGFVQLLKAG